MAVMEAYFDESDTHDGSPFVCVAGYLFEKGNATALDIAGDGCVKKMGCLSSACQIARTELDHLRVARKTIRTNLEIRAFELVKTYATHGFAASVDMDDFHLIPNPGLFDTAYSFACLQMLLGRKAVGRCNNNFDGGSHISLRAANASTRGEGIHGQDFQASSNEAGLQVLIARVRGQGR